MSSRAEDVLEIQTLKARYADAVDGGWTGTRPHDADAVLELFVEDGVWDGGEYGRGEGHAGIREYMLTGDAIMPFAFHHITNPRIEVDGDVARARWHVLLAVETEGQAQLHVGIYDDEMVRTAEGWKFKRLGFTPAARTDLPGDWKLF